MTEKTSCGKKTKTAVKGSEEAEQAENRPGQCGAWDWRGRAQLEADAGAMVLELVCSAWWRRRKGLDALFLQLP